MEDNRLPQGKYSDDDYIGIVMGGYLDSNNRLMDRTELNRRIVSMRNSINRLKMDDFFEEDWQLNIDDMTVEELRSKILLMHSWVKQHQYAVNNANKIKNDMVNTLKKDLKWALNTIEVADSMIDDFDKEMDEGETMEEVNAIRDRHGISFK